MNRYDTAVPGFAIRVAREGDTGLILDFLRRLAEYERSTHGIGATEAMLHDALFLKKQAEAIIGELDGRPAAFAIFFHNFSTFLGKANLYLEDLYVDEEERDKGLGRTMFSCLARIALERNCGRLDWWCLDRNQPAIAFYRRMGALPMSDWTIYRVEGQRLVDLSDAL